MRGRMRAARARYSRERLAVAEASAIEMYPLPSKISGSVIGRLPRRRDEWGTYRFLDPGIEFVLDAVRLAPVAEGIDRTQLARELLAQ